MLRKFTKAIGRYKAGAVHDYPKAVWDKLAKDAKLKLDKFSTEVEFNQGHQNPMRGPVVKRTRAGAAA